MATITVLDKDTVYIGIGNRVNYFDGAEAVTHYAIGAGNANAGDTEVEVVFQNADDERTFRMVPLVDLFEVDGQPVVIK